MYSQQKFSNTCKFNRNKKFRKHSGYSAWSGHGTILANNVLGRKKSKGRRHFNRVLTHCELNDLNFLSQKYLQHGNATWKKYWSSEISKENQHKEKVYYRENKYKYPEINNYTEYDHQQGFKFYCSKEDQQNILKILSHYVNNRKFFINREMIIEHYHQIFSPFQVDYASLRYILEYYKYTNILCVQPDNGFLLNKLACVSKLSFVSNYIFLDNKKNDYILKKYYPLDSDASTPLNICAINYTDSEVPCIWWDLEKQTTITWSDYKHYALLMTHYDENILKLYQGSFIILLDKQHTIKNWNIMYRHRDFVIYQHGGVGVSFYNKK